MNGVENRCLGYHKLDSRFPGRHFKRPEGEEYKLVLDVGESLKMNADRISHYAREYGEDAELMIRTFRESLVAEAEDPHNLEYLARLASGHSTRFSREVVSGTHRKDKYEVSGSFPDRRKRKRDPRELAVRDEEVVAGTPDLEEELELAEGSPEYL